MPMGTQVQARGAFTQALGGTCVGRFDAVCIERHEGVGVLREPPGHGLGQWQVPRRSTEHRFGQLQIEGAGVTRKNDVVLRSLPLARQLVGHTMDKQGLRRAGPQRERKHDQPESPQWVQRDRSVNRGPTAIALSPATSGCRSECGLNRIKPRSSTWHAAAM
jgi:hypothetical protein